MILSFLRLVDSILDWCCDRITTFLLKVDGFIDDYR